MNVLTVAKQLKDYIFKPMWTIDEAIPVAREIDKTVRSFDFFACIGGSVLTNGSSSNDLDIVIIPYEGYEQKSRRLWLYLAKEFNADEEDTDYPDLPDREILIGKYQDKKIDFIIMKGKKL